MAVGIIRSIPIAIRDRSITPAGLVQVKGFAAAALARLKYSLISRVCLPGPGGGALERGGEGARPCSLGLCRPAALRLGSGVAPFRGGRTHRNWGHAGGLDEGAGF